jgi:hypothetical protein
MEILECKKVPWPKPLITKVHKVDNCGWPKQEAAYECKINLMTGKTHQVPYLYFFKVIAFLFKVHHLSATCSYCMERTLLKTCFPKLD